MDPRVLPQTSNRNTEAVGSTVLEQARLHRDSQFLSAKRNLVSEKKVREKKRERGRETKEGERGRERKEEHEIGKKGGRKEGMRSTVRPNI